MRIILNCPTLVQVHDILRVLSLTRHASYHGPTTLSVTGVFLSLDLVCGTVYLQIYDLRCNSGHSGDNSKQYCSV